MFKRGNEYGFDLIQSSGYANFYDKIATRGNKSYNFEMVMDRENCFIRPFAMPDETFVNQIIREIRKGTITEQGIGKLQFTSQGGKVEVNFTVVDTNKPTPNYEIRFLNARGENFISKAFKMTKLDLHLDVNISDESVAVSLISLQIFIRKYE